VSEDPSLLREDNAEFVEVQSETDNARGEGQGDRFIEVQDVRISGLTQEGVNCFHKIFAKIGSRVKSFEKSTN